MMPAVTVPPRPNGLPIAITQSPTRESAGIAEVDEGKRLVRRDLEHREIGGGVAADQLGGIFGAVGQGDGDRFDFALRHRR